MESKPVLFIDLLNLYCRSFASVPLTNDNGEHVGGVYGSLNALQSYVKRLSRLNASSLGRGHRVVREDARS